jgi:hypothetical protein
MSEKISVDDTVITLAASVVDRTRDLIQDGWVKGQLNAGFNGAETFCIHGAMGLALQEVFGYTGDTGRVNVCGGYAADNRGYGQVEAMATAFIVDEANAQFKYGGRFTAGNLAAAPFNDAPERKHGEVLSVLGQASKRLWNLSVCPDETEFQFSKWVDIDVQAEEAQQFLYAQLGN